VDDLSRPAAVCTQDKHSRVVSKIIRLWLKLFDLPLIGIKFNFLLMSYYLFKFHRPMTTNNNIFFNLRARFHYMRISSRTHSDGTESTVIIDNINII